MTNLDVFSIYGSDDPRNRELTDADFCPLCGVCLPADERCTSENFKGSICPHAEAAAAQANL